MTDAASGRSADVLLTRLGIDQRDLLGPLRALELWDDGPTDDAAAVLEAALSGAVPEQVLAVFVALAEAQPEAWKGARTDAGVLRVIAAVAGASEPLGRVLATKPSARVAVEGPLEPWLAADVRAACGREVDGRPDAAAALAAVQRRGLVRVAARDLLGLSDTPRASAELAELADGVLAAGLDVVAGEADADMRLAVIAMGKLGGRELNYVSDVDVLFVYDGDRARAARTAERFMRLLATATPEGRAYELDANLRPEGKDGPLVRTLDAYRSYYERWAKTWEYQALLKARPVAGDAELGVGFMELTRPFVWPDRREAAAVDEIQRLKAVVEQSEEVRRAGPRQVKLAPGGLRDIEFAVQLLQLVHGRHDEALRSPNTLEALAALAEGGYVDEGDASLFSDAYVFLRTVEHRVQLRRLRRTHVIPGREELRYRLARACGFRDLPAAGALEQFDRELGRVQAYVRRLHEKLFYRPLLDRFAELSAAEHLVAGGGLDEESARERLTALGFADPERALENLSALASGVTRPARLFRTLLPALLPTLAASPDPDGGLAGFRSLAERLSGAPVFLRTLRDAPPVGELLATVLGRSRLVGEWLERQPDAFSQLADLGGLDARLDAADYRRLGEGLLRRGDDRDETAEALRRLKRREAARIAVRDLSDRADELDVASELTALAQACLDAAVAVVTDDTRLRLAVIGMGKLGGRELGYASDLDVLLVFEPGEARDDAVRAAEALLGFLSGVTPEGQAFRVDLGLRPEGKDGPLVRTLDSYATYYSRWAEPWELQALTQARPVAGDAELGAAFLQTVSGIVYPDRVPATRLAAVRRMKARVERERAGGRRAGRPRHVRRPGVPRRGGVPANLRRPAPWTGDRADLKLGPGGLSDVEWTVQLLQLEHGGLRPEVRGAGTLAALAALEAAGVVGDRDAQWLREGYRLLLRARNMLYLAGFRDTGVLPAGARDTERVARMLGYAHHGTQAFLEELRRATRRVRRVHERLFYPDTE